MVRPWVEQEWTSYMATEGPTGVRIIPVALEHLELADLPLFLRPIQFLQANDRDAKRVARELAQRAGLPGKMIEEDPRRLTSARNGSRTGAVICTPPTGQPSRDDVRSCFWTTPTPNSSPRSTTLP